MLKAGIIGATGYTGLALISTLLSHPDAAITLITSNTYKGKRISDIFPLLKGRFEDGLVPTNEDHRDKCDVYFLCLPHGTSMESARALYNGKALIVDLSADFRFEDLRIYESAYIPHTAKELIPHAVFGLPELYRDKIKGAKLIGNPGCYPTSAILGLYPLLKAGLVSGDIFVDSKSGVSGAGREARLGSLFCEVSEGFRAYNVGVHRHEPEIQKEVSKLADSKIMFVPHLLPMNRGILTTIYSRLKEPLKTKDVLELYRKTYEGEPFVRIMDEGVYPDTRFVRFSNYCDIGLKAFDDGRIVIISAIDNLVKGASGQAVQNMNVALGINETTALTGLPQYP
ncbi:N-acetyl-gamma-glutamyl-phosphate reductase [Syntrophorhabdus aromaticivorans]|uniref:N-acetyl-gamma-glutamyl-phosphate reductase n=1 Tax=Syntrophorhabdus aromaticivorans TaxID=328301 RepID=UPI0003FFE29A|nr:N-acetyl-gamma-glutamyl-phosphate reductase [Syntrophorhabdus aromaticivorans]